LRLRHYTNSYESAISIINSKQLWLGRIGVAKDTNEVLHYLNIFNNIHTIEEIKGIVSQLESPPTESLYIFLIQSICQSYFYKVNRLQIGNILGEVLRKESYIVCFTEDDSSIFHEQEYGPVSFVFSNNPLEIEKYPQYDFVEKRVQYINTKEFDVLNRLIEEFYIKSISKYEHFYTNENFFNMLYGIRSFIKNNYNKKEQKALRKKLIKDAEELFTSCKKQIEAFKKILNEIFSGDNKDILKMKGIGQYLEQKINNVRENRILRLDDPKSAQYHRIMGTFKHNIRETHIKNLISCFLKDIKFKNDNEIRVIALPNSNHFNKDGNILKVDLNMKLLEKVLVSSSLENRTEIISMIKNELIKNGLNHVEVG
jgi:hypothetical protein